MRRRLTADRSSARPLDLFELTELELSDGMRKVERRTVDAILVVPGLPPRILEVDEKRHFNAYRAATLRRYKDEVPLAFDADL